MAVKLKLCRPHHDLVQPNRSLASCSLTWSAVWCLQSFYFALY